MRRTSSHPLSLIAAALVALQALWSGLAATAYAAGVDEARYLCANVALNAEARAHLAELAELLGEEAPDPVYDPDDCPECALAKPALLASLVVAPERSIDLQYAKSPRRTERASPRQTTGPPVGLRAPPIQS